MIVLSAHQAANKAFSDIMNVIGEAMDLTLGQSQLLLAVGGVLLASYVFYQLWRYVSAVPDLPAQGASEASGKSLISRRRLYAVLGLVAGVVFMIFGYLFYVSPLIGIGALLAVTSLLTMGIVSLVDRRRREEESAGGSNEVSHCQLWIYEAISLLLGMFLLSLGLEGITHAQKVERMKAAEAGSKAAANHDEMPKKKIEEVKEQRRVSGRRLFNLEETKRESPKGVNADSTTLSDGMPSEGKVVPPGK